MGDSAKFVFRNVEYLGSLTSNGSIIITPGGHAQNTAEDRREQQLTSVLLLKKFLFETRRRLKSTDNGVGLMAEMVKHSQPRGFFFSGGG